MLLAQYRGERAERSVQDATGSWSGSCWRPKRAGGPGRVIEILVLRALADQMLGDIPAALAALERAMMLAEPEGYVRVFADEGAPMISLLRAAAKQRDQAALCPADSWPPRAGPGTAAPIRQA